MGNDRQHSQRWDVETVQLPYTKHSSKLLRGFKKGVDRRLDCKSPTSSRLQYLEMIGVLSAWHAWHGIPRFSVYGNETTSGEPYGFHEVGRLCCPRKAQSSHS